MLFNITRVESKNCQVTKQQNYVDSNLYVYKIIWKINHHFSTRVALIFYFIRTPILQANVYVILNSFINKSYILVYILSNESHLTEQYLHQLFNIILKIFNTYKKLHFN